jgi:hypothetical protein
MLGAEPRKLHKVDCESSNDRSPRRSDFYAYTWRMAETFK